MNKLSAVIITYNEEKNIERCLQSLDGIADEIIVVDSFSTDKTEEICLKYGARFFPNPFEGYSQQKSIAAGMATHNIVLSLDADEALSEQLKASLLKAKENWEADAYSFNRINNFCGQWIKHGGWYPDKQLRLWDKTKGEWNGSPVHEKVELRENSKIGFLKGDLLHYSYYSIDEYISQLNKYSDLKAEKMLLQGKKFNPITQIIKSTFKFLINYIIKLGFLDGYFGFVFGISSSFATFITYAKLRQKYKALKN